VKRASKAPPRAARTSCAWCGRDPVPIKRGRIASHLTPGGVKCVAVGIDEAQNRRFT
jgi:hypothetical protein